MNDTIEALVKKKTGSDINETLHGGFLVPFLMYRCAILVWYDHGKLS